MKRKCEVCKQKNVYGTSLTCSPECAHIRKGKKGLLNQEKPWVKVDVKKLKNRTSRVVIAEIKDNHGEFLEFNNPFTFDNPDDAICLPFNQGFSI